MNTTPNDQSIPKMISLNKWLETMGVTSITGWRWRKRGILKTVNIYGRQYISAEAAADFCRRAEAGEFAKNTRPGSR